MKKYWVRVVVGVGVVVGLGAAVTNRMPILRGYLQSDFDGNGHAFTNVGTFRGSNFIDAATGLPVSGGGPLTGDVTSSGAVTTLAAGNAGNLNSGTLLAARLPALTGAITTSAGSAATSLGSFTSANLLGALTDETGSGAAVFGTAPTLGVPAIADFTSATHGHTAASSGGTLGASAIASGTLGTARLGSGSATANTLLHGDSTWSAVSLSSDVTGTLPIGSVGQPGNILTNGESVATVFSNNVSIDAAHFLRVTNGIGVGSSLASGAGNIDMSGTLTSAGGITLASGAALNWASEVGMSSTSAKEAGFFGSGFTSMATLYLGDRGANTVAVCITNGPPSLHLKNGTRADYIPLTVSNLFSVGTITATNGFIEQVVTKTIDYTATAADSIILINGATKTITLPTAVGNTGKHFTVKLIASGTTGTIATTSSQNIDAATTYSLSAQYKYAKVISDGSQWWICANN